MPDITWALSDEGYVQAYVVKEDILNRYIGEIPLGTTIYLKQQHNGWLPGISTLDKINNHSIDSVIFALKEDGYK